MIDMLSEIDTRIMKKDLYDKMNDFIKKSWNGDFEANYRGLAAVNSKTYESEDALAAAQKNYLVTDVARTERWLTERWGLSRLTKMYIPTATI